MLVLSVVLASVAPPIAGPIDPVARVFLAGALVVGRALSPRLFGLAGRLRGQGQGILLITALVVCFLLAYVASAVGLAPIVGAYAAGLVLEEAHYVELVGRSGRSLQ